MKILNISGTSYYGNDLFPSIKTVIDTKPLLPII